MSNEVLPNQRATWAKLSKAVEEFDVWKQRTERRYASENTEFSADHRQPALCGLWQ